VPYIEKRIKIVDCGELHGNEKLNERNAGFLESYTFVGAGQAKD
jgi:hypothetical protein